MVVGSNLGVWLTRWRSARSSVRWRVIRVTNAELAAVNLHPDAFHPEWNYSIKPRS